MADTPSPVSDADFARFCEFFYRRTGILFTPAKRYFVDRRLAERMQATASRSFAVYLARLRSEANGEIENLINAFTINETYFYREDHQLRCLTASLLPEMVAGRPRVRPSGSGRCRARPARSRTRWRSGSWRTGPRSTATTSRSSARHRHPSARRGRGRAVRRARPDAAQPGLVARYFIPEETRLGPAWRILLADLRDSVRFTPAT